MTSEKTIECLFRTIDDKEWKNLNIIFHQDIIYERPGYQPLIGINCVKNFYENERLVLLGQHQIEQMIVVGNQGACWGQIIGTKKDGSIIDELFADVYHFRDHLIIARRSYFFRPAI